MAWEEVKTPWVKFSKIGDNIYGTLISVREMKSTLPGKEGEVVKIYEIKADGGEFHEIDEDKRVIDTPITIKEGSIMNVGGGYIDTRFRNIKLGTKIKVEFTSEIPATRKGFSNTKVKNVYTNGKMDEEWLKEEEEKGNQAF